MFKFSSPMSKAYVVGGGAAAAVILSLAVAIRSRKNKTEHPEEKKSEEWEPMTIDQFRAAAHSLVDLIADSSLSPFPSPSPQQEEVEKEIEKSHLWLHELLGVEVPVESEDWTKLQEKLKKMIMILNKNALNVQFSRERLLTMPSALAEIAFTGISTTSSITSSISGDILSEIERIVSDWIAKLLGLKGYVGVFELSTFDSLLTCVSLAKQRLLQQLGEDQQILVDNLLVAYLPDHTWPLLEYAEKTHGKVLPCIIRQIPTAAANNHVLNVESLNSQIQLDLKEGLVPFFAVGSFGGGVAGISDNLVGLAQLCRQNDVWLHVEATSGGLSAVCPEFRTQFETATKSKNVDSISVGLMGLVTDGISEQNMVFFSPGNGALPIVIKRIHQIDSNTGLEALRIWFNLHLMGQSKLQLLMRRRHQLGLLVAEKIKQESSLFTLISPSQFGCVNFKLKGSNIQNAQLVENLEYQVGLSPVWVGDSFFLQLYCADPSLTEAQLNITWEQITFAAKKILQKQ